MLAQRGADIASRQTTKRKAAAAPTRTGPVLPEARAAKRKLSFNEKHALETLPQRIAALEAKVSKLRNRLDDPDLYARDRQAFAEATDALAASESELSAAEEKWLELEILRGEIEQS
jgi:ATP-binding cassette subfamily F protein uup